MSKGSKVLLAHPGTQYAPHLARELFVRGALSRFATGFALGDSAAVGRVERLLGSRLRRRLARRRVSVPATEIENFFWLEALTLCRLKFGAPAERVLHARNRWFQNAIPKEWIIEATHNVGFDTSSWILGERCKALSRPFILDRSIGHPRAKERVYEKLRTNFPDWAGTILQKNEAQMGAEDLEHRLATHIVVPSRFVRDTLVQESVGAERISIIPFGTDLELFRPAEVMPAAPPVVFLYAGTLSARKGLPVLLQAWKEADLGSRAELWLTGSGKMPESVRRLNGVRYFGRLEQAKLAELMRRAHAFVFPSFFEGLAQVQVQALASGVPVIGTYESGATEVVIENETGFIVPAGSVNQLAECLVKLADDPVLLGRLREQCIRTRESHSWRIYGDKWCGLLERINKT